MLIYFLKKWNNAVFECDEANKRIAELEVELKLSECITLQSSADAARYRRERDEAREKLASLTGEKK